MLAFLLIFLSTLFHEASDSIGKKSIKQRRETAHSFIFLSSFWGVVVMVGIIAFGPPTHFSVDSLPTLIPRIVLEIFLAYLGAESIIRAQRSTVGFLRLLNIPLLLAVDLALGYVITPLQAAGILVLFLALAFAFRHNARGKKGAGFVILWTLLAVVAVSLHKYNITHFNSVMVEQAIVIGAIMVFFGARALHSGQSPLQLLARPVTGFQAASSGLSIVLASFALALAPASVIIALKRTFSLMWSMLFGQAYFHEGAFRQKAYSYAIAVAGVCLIASPYFL